MKVLFIFGTRPEAIKLAPVIKYLELQKEVVVKICNTEQHQEMSNNILDIFEIKADYNLDIMSPNQTLFTLTTKLLSSIESVLNIEKPDIVVVQGDTTSAFVGSLASFYNKIKVAHIEAGLRTFNKYSPFPEEVNRELISKIASFHFVPTKTNAINLLKENIDENIIFEVGNTVIDSLKFMKNKINSSDKYKSKLEEELDLFGYKITDRKIILITGHRRENFGQLFINIFEALKEISLKHPDVDIVYPVHLNPNVKDVAFDMLNKISNIYLISPLNYDQFVFLMMKSYLIITDSGGIQEEAPSLKIPTFVTRDTTERIEVLDNGSIKLVGTSKNKIIEAVSELLNSELMYYEYVNIINNPYGDGISSNKIYDIIKRERS